MLSVTDVKPSSVCNVVAVFVSGSDVDVDNDSVDGLD